MARVGDSRVVPTNDKGTERQPATASEPSRTFARRDLERILSLATALQCIDMERAESPGTSDGLCATDIYDIAAESGIEQRYVRDAFERLYLSSETKRTDAQRVGARPNALGVADTYCNHILPLLQNALIEENVVVKRKRWSVYEGVLFVSRRPHRSFWPWRRSTSTRIADMTIFGDGGINIYICINDPRFINICADEMNWLRNDVFREVLDVYKVMYTYPLV